MSDSTPPKPKPGSLRDRIAAFEQKPASSPAPPTAHRAKPGNLSQWKPRVSPPPESSQPTNRNDNSMSATDAKESITKGGSLKERMAALKGLGAFGGGPAASPPPKPSEKPKWKPPPQVTVAPSVTGDDGEDASASGVVDTKPAVSSLKMPPDEEITAESPPTGNDDASVTVSDVPGGREEEADPEEEERQRRAAIAARMARLGGTRVGVGPPIFGLKPEVKTKPVALATERAKEELPIADAPVREPDLKTERDAESGQAEAETAENALPVVVSPQTQSALPEYISQQSSPAASPNIPPRAMPLLQGPRRAAPPRKKVASKPTVPTETEVTPESLGEDTPGVASDGLPLPTPVSSHVETEVVAAGPIADSFLSEPASERPTEESFGGPTPIVPSPEEKSEPPPPPARLPSDSSDPRPESPEESQVDSRTKHDFLHLDDPIELDVPSELRVLRDESEFGEATAHEPSRDGTSMIEEEDEDEDETSRQQRIAERISKTGGFNPIGQPVTSPPLDETTTLHVDRKSSVDTLPAGTGGSTFESQPSQLGAPLVSQQGGSANAVNDEDGGDNGKY